MSLVADFLQSLMSSVNGFMPSFSVCTPATSFSRLTVLATTARRMWKQVIRRDILAFYLILGTNLSFANIKYALIIASFCCRCSLLSWRNSPLFLVYYEFLSWMGVVFCQMLFSFIQQYNVTFFICTLLIWWINLHFFIFMTGMALEN